MPPQQPQIMIFPMFRRSLLYKIIITNEVVLEPVLFVLVCVCILVCT